MFGNQLVTNTIPKFYDNFNQAGFYDFELRQLIESCEITHGILVYGSSSGSDKDALINCKIFIHNLMKLNQIEEIRPEYPLKIPDSLSLHAKAKYVSEFINGLFAFHLGHDIKRISAF